MNVKLMKRLTSPQKIELSEIVDDFSQSRNWTWGGGYIVIDNEDYAQVIMVDGKLGLLWAGEWDLQVFGTWFIPTNDIKSDENFYRFTCGKRINFSGGYAND